MLATNAEKYNGTADVVTNAAWDLYKIAENYDPYKTTKAIVSLTNSKSSAAAGSSGAIKHSVESTKDRHTSASDLQIIKRSVNLEKKSLSRKEAVKKLRDWLFARYRLQEILPQRIQKMRINLILATKDLLTI